MSDQSPINALQSSTRKLVRDAVELAELQLQLFRADGQEMAKKSTPPLLTAVAGVTIAMSSLPLLLVGFAYALVEVAGLSVWIAMFCSAFSGIAVGALAFVIGLRWLKPQLEIWRRSTAELKENVEFLKRSLEA